MINKPKLAKNISAVDGGLRFQQSCICFYVHMKLLRMKFCVEGKDLQHSDIRTKFIKLSKSALAPTLTHIFHGCINKRDSLHCCKIE